MWTFRNRMFKVDIFLWENSMEKIMLTLIMYKLGLKLNQGYTVKKIEIHLPIRSKNLDRKT